MAIEGGAAKPVYITNNPPFMGGAATPVALMAADGVTPLAVVTSPLSAEVRNQLGIDNQLVVPLIFAAPNASAAWTAQPAALTEFPGTARVRTKADLTRFVEARIVCAVVVNGAAGAEIRLQYSTDQSNWFYLDNSSGPKIALAGAVALAVSAWVALTAAARADVFLRVAGINGDASASPAINNLTAQFR